MTSRVPPKGPLLVIAGATLMATAIFLPVVIGPETSFVSVHRQYFWFDDWRQYGGALMVPLTVGLAGVGALARPGSRAARAALVVAAAGAVVVAFGALAYDLTRSSKPQVESAYLRAVIGLAFGATIVLAGTVVAARSSTSAREAGAEGRSGAEGPLLGLAGAFLLAAAQPVALAIGTREIPGRTGATIANAYASYVGWTIWGHRWFHLLLLSPAILLTAVSLWVLAAPSSRRAAAANLGVSTALVFAIPGAAAIAISRAVTPPQRTFLIQVALIAGAGAILGAVGGWVDRRNWRGRTHQQTVVVSTLPERWNSG